MLNILLAYIDSQYLLSEHFDSCRFGSVKIFLGSVYLKMKSNTCIQISEILLVHFNSLELRGKGYQLGLSIIISKKKSDLNERVGFGAIGQEEESGIGIVHCYS